MKLPRRRFLHLAVGAAGNATLTLPDHLRKRRPRWLRKMANRKLSVTEIGLDVGFSGLVAAGLVFPQSIVGDCTTEAQNSKFTVWAQCG
jgi:hypothetical protein